MARVVKEVVSDAIMNHLNDPRIQGFVSVTRVDLAADLKNADVFLSVFGTDEKTQHRTFVAIDRASRRIQYLLGNKLQSKFCPILHFAMDEQFKQTLETLRIIDEAVKDLGPEDEESSEDQNSDSQ